MTRLEKLMDVNTMAKFLAGIVQNCDFCPCMEEGVCNGSISTTTCVRNFKEYLSQECGKKR